MQHDLIGYLLGALEVEEQKRVEALLNSDAEASRQLEVLRDGVELLRVDYTEVEVPVELSLRTCRWVREQGNIPG